MTTWTTFGTLTNATGAELDGNMSLLVGMADVPVTISGTNTLALTEMVSGLTVSAYSDFISFFGTAVSNNSGATTAGYGALGQLPVYKDGPSGPEALVGGEIKTNNIVQLTYDSSLNSGNGGFHLQIDPTVALAAYLPLAGGTLTGPLIGTSISAATVTSPLLGVPSTASQVTSILSGAAAVTFSSIVPGGYNEQPLTITGVSVGDVVALGLPSPTSVGIVYDGYVSVTDIVMIRAQNITSGSTITPTTGTYRATAIRSSP
ncbi:MAG: hypothetical protein KGL39_07575 [Patescibacteria group bacterium]|nr:hypothetical protein [Patescibacteria group bacterium]